MATDTTNSLFGEVKNPLNFTGKGYGDLFGKNGSGGPLTLLSNIFQLIAVAAGLYALVNFVLAGMQYISSQGDPKQTEQAWQKITMSFIGLAAIALSFILAAIIGQIFFGSAGAILSPQIYGPGGGTTTP